MTKKEEMGYTMWANKIAISNKNCNQFLKPKISENLGKLNIGIKKDLSWQKEKK